MQISQYKQRIVQMWMKAAQMEHNCMHNHKRILISSAQTWPGEMPKRDAKDGFSSRQKLCIIMTYNKNKKNQVIVLL